MKTYLFDTINRFKRFSKQLDVKTIICDKAWQVFNDSGEKELYIFNTDGTVLITLNGVVTHGTWQFIAANDSLIITAANQSYMVHPAFLDDCLFALQVDGTDQVAFLIDQKNSQSFAPQTYQQVIDYFANKERNEMARIAQGYEAAKTDGTGKNGTQGSNKEAVLSEEDENRLSTVWCDYIRNPSISETEHIEIVSLILAFVALLAIPTFITVKFGFLFPEHETLSCLIEGVVTYLFISVVLYFIHKKILDQQNECSQRLTQKYISEHPNDPINSKLEMEDALFRNRSVSFFDWIDWMD